MKVANITWITYLNFGTFLQAYALQEYIKSVGIQCTTLNDATKVEKHLNWKLKIKKLYWSLQQDYRLFMRSQEQSRMLYEDFKSKYIKLEWHADEPNYLNKEYDCFVCGSHQIWNPYSLRNKHAGFYYAEFACKKKVAYAPSVGVSSIPDDCLPRFKNLINDFSFLSAREREGKEIMQKLTGKCVLQVVDPTLLVGKDQWENFVRKQNVKPYVLGYFLTPNNRYINAAKEYAREKGLEFRMLYTDRKYRSVTDKLITAGPIEFLQAIHDAHIVFTDSFHGSIFSVIFRTPFVTFKRFRNSATSQNSRVENLLKTMGLSDRLIDENEVHQINSLKEIDFDDVWKRLSPMIDKSKKYLVDAIKE